MRTPVLVGICLAVAGCAGPTRPSAEVQQENDRWVQARARRVAECADAHAAEVDDRISDATTIALALSLRCNDEYRQLVTAVSSTMDNDAQSRAVEARMNSREKRVEFFLVSVMKSRQIR